MKRGGKGGSKMILVKSCLQGCCVGSSSSSHVATCTSLSRRSSLSIAIKFSSKSSTEGRRSRETWGGSED